MSPFTFGCDGGSADRCVDDSGSWCCRDTVPAIFRSYPRHARSRRLLVAGIVILAVGCGDDDDADPSESSTPVTVDGTTDDAASTQPDATTVVADPEFCGPMEELANYNAEAPPPDPAGEWVTVQEELVSRGNGAMGLYDEVIAVAPAEVEGQLATLRDYSQNVLDMAEEATSADEFATELGTPPQDVLTAATELNDYITEACGFGLTSGE